MITKKQIIEIADVIKKIPVYDMDGNEVTDCVMDSPVEGIFLNMNPHDVVRVFADFLAAQNPNFNRKRFIGYVNGTCGPNGGRV